jgi:IS5 family transposase
MRFCGLSLADPVPDANTLWDFREALIRSGALDRLFGQLDRAIRATGYLPMSGQIIDASLVAAPRQRNTDGEKAAIKAGKTAAEIWPDKPAKAAQKDTDARWTLKTSKGKVEADGTARRDLASRPSATSRTSASTAGMASSAGRRSPTPLRMTAPAARGSARPDEYRLRRLGRHRLLLKGQ